MRNNPKDKVHQKNAIKPIQLGSISPLDRPVAGTVITQSHPNANEETATVNYSAMSFSTGKAVV